MFVVVVCDKRTKLKTKGFFFSKISTSIFQIKNFEFQLFHEKFKILVDTHKKINFQFLQKNKILLKFNTK